MMGCVVSVYDVDEVMMALGITVAVVVGLTLFALQTKIDFTGNFLQQAMIFQNKYLDTYSLFSNFPHYL